MIADIANVIRSADPEKRSELKELAEALLRDEISSIPEQIPTEPAASASASQRSSPLFPGILLTAFGLMFFLMFPLVGVAIAVIGVGLTIWGVVLSVLRR